MFLRLKCLYRIEDVIVWDLGLLKNPTQKEASR